VNQTEGYTLARRNVVSAGPYIGQTVTYIGHTVTYIGHTTTI